MHAGTLTLFAVALGVAGTAQATFGPETEVPFNPSFIAASSPDTAYIQLGPIVSKRYVIFTAAAAFAPTFVTEFRFGDLNGPPMTFTDIVLDGPMPYALRKTCFMPSGYKSISFTTKDTVDYTKNNTAIIYYYRMSTKKYYTRSTDVIRDDLCSEEYVGSSDGDETYGCVRKDTSADGCNIFLDTVDGTTYDVFTYVISNGIVLGEQVTDFCSAPDVAIESSLFFYKLQGFRDELLALATFDNQ